MFPIKKYNLIKITYLAVVSIAVFGFSYITTSAISPNLINNGNLETQAVNPILPQFWQKGGTGANTRVLTYPVAGYNSARAAKTEITSYTNGDAKWYFQDVPVVAGETYKFKDMFNSTTTSFVTFRYTLSNGTFQYPDLQKNIPAAGAWTSFEKNFTVPTNYAFPVSSVTLFHLIKSIGSIIVDDYSLTYVDTHAPTINMATVSANSLSGNILFSSSAADNIGVMNVDYYIDSTLVGSILNSPYEYTLDSTTIADGVHTIYAIAYDEAGNFTQTQTQSFYVQNAIGVTTGILNVKVHMINDNNGISNANDFNFHVKNNNIDVVNSPSAGSETGILYYLPIETYDVSIDTYTGYDISYSASCINGQVQIFGNDNIECIITLNDTPPPTGSITVNNIIINDNGGIKTLLDFVMFVDVATVASGEVLSVPVGLHSISEITDPNYTRTISGDCDANGLVNVNQNENKVCTITNDDIQPAPPYVNPNLIPNPSVETVGSNPIYPQSWQKGGSGTNTRVLTYPVAGYDGVKAVKTEITSYTTGDAKWYFTPIASSSSQQFTFSDYYRSNTTSYVTMQYQLQNGTYKYQDIAYGVAAAPSWTKVTANFTVPTYASPVVTMTAFHLIKSVGYLTVDNYSIASYLPPPGDPTNLISNPSVEVAAFSNASAPYGFSYTSSAGITATPSYPVPGYDSAKAIRIDATVYTSGSGAKWYFQSIPVLPGEEYRYSDYYMSSANSYVVAQFHINDGTTQYMDLLRLTPTPTFKKAEDTFSVPANADSLMILHVIKEVGYLVTDNFRLTKLTNGAFATGMVTFSFDDGLASVYDNAVPILTQAGIKSSHYIITNEMTLGDPTYMTTAQVLGINNLGNEIGSHTKNHAHLAQIPYADMVSQINDSKSALANIGATPNSVFVYPYGEYNDVVRQTIIDAGYIGARSVRAGYNTKNSDKFTLRDQHIEINTTPAQVINYINTAMANHTWLILELHDTNNLGDQYSNTVQTLQDIVDYIVANNIPVVTTAEGISLMNP